MTASVDMPPYDEGGYLPPGVVTLSNDTGRPIRVLPLKDLAAWIAPPYTPLPPDPARRGVTDRRVRTQLLRVERRAARRNKRAWHGWTPLGFIDGIELAGDTA